MSIKNQCKKEKKRIKNYIIALLTGLFSGFINGLFGGGGGMVVVPMLTNFLKFKPNNSHATAILIILPFSIISGIIYLMFGCFDYEIGIPVSIGVILGGVIGALLLSKLSSKWTMLIFTIVMAFAGTKMLFF